MYYPVVLKIAERPVVVIGGGSVAEQKVQSLMESGAAVTVVSPDVTSCLLGLASTGAISWRRRTYQASDLRDAFLVVAATDDEQVQEEIWRDARDANVLV